MSHSAPRRPTTYERSWLDRIPVGLLSALETLLLGLLAAILVLRAIPDAFEIESSCVGAIGRHRSAGDTYNAGFVTLGTLGWLGVLLGTMYASIAERRGIVVLLPLLWFLTLVLSALGVAVLLGPERCPR